MNITRPLVGIILFATITINGQNVSPVANNDNYTVGLNRPRTISASDGLSANDTDANIGTILEVQSLPLSGPNFGSVSLNGDGGFTYTPDTGFVGTDSFTYRVCDDGSPNPIVSRFDFDNPDLTIATIGPNATSVNPLAAQLGCGVYFPTGAGGSTGFDINIPNSGGIFNFTSFTASFEYEDQESTADIITAGNFRVYHITGNEIGIRIDVINGTTGLPDSFTTTLGNFANGNTSYSINYDEVTGNITYTGSGSTTVFSVAPAYSPLDSSLASDILLGRFMDGSGSTRPSLCSMEFIDNSRLCNDATATLNVIARIVTNRRITYRVNPD